MNDINRDTFAEPEKKKRSKNSQQRRGAYRSSEEPSAAGKSGLFLLKVLVVCACAAATFFYGSDRIASANRLEGSTQLPDNMGSTIIDFEITSGTDDTTKDSEPTYRYIDAKRLDEKTPMELAIWFMSYFGNGEEYNETEKAEFEDWYNKKTILDRSFSTEFQEAMTYIHEHPEVLEPEPEPEMPAEGEAVDTPAEGEDASPSGDDTTDGVEPTQPTPPPATTSPQPQQNQGTTNNTGTTQQPNGGQSSNNGGTTPRPQEQTPPPADPEEDKYPNIDEDALDKLSAAALANWVVDNLKPGDSAWKKYQIQTDLFSWLATKDREFVDLVNAHLEAMGWDYTQQ